MSFFYEIYRWFLRKFLNRDYVRFEISSSCTGIIKSCVPLHSSTVKKIQTEIKECGYLTPKQQNTLILKLGVYIAENKFFKASKYSFGCHYIRDFDRGVGKLILTLSED